MSTRVLVLMLCSIMLPAGTVQAVSTIDPSDPNILYTGRWDSSTPSQPWSYWIGSSIIVNFEGTGIAARFFAGWGSDPDYLRIIIDDDVANSIKIPVGTAEATYTLASGLSDSVHKIEIVKETDQSIWTFFRFELDDGKSLTSPPARPPRRIEFYGDSNLAGNSLESEMNQSGGHLRGSYNGYAGIVSRMFDAEYHNLSRSGATISGINGVYNRVDYWAPAPTWDFNDFPADVVVVGLGANNLPAPKPSIKSEYHAFLDDLRAVHPDAHIVLYNGWGWDYDEPANYTDEVIAERGDPNMSSAIFPWIFEQWHGCEYDHAGMAQLLADHLTSVLGWSQGPRDVMNGYGMNGDVANGGFEEVAPFGGYGWRYYTHAGVSRVYDPAGAHEDSYYLRLENGAESHQPIPAVAGETFNLNMWMRGAQDGDRVVVYMDFRDQEMWTPPLQNSLETKTLTTNWQLYSMTATAPTGTANPVFHHRVTFKAYPGSIVDIDGVAMSAPTGVTESVPSTAAYHLSATPNPFNPSTRIRYTIPEAASLLLTVHDVSGRKVATLAQRHHEAGEFVTTWDGRDDAGREVSSGVYFMRMEGAKFTATRKMVLLK